ncbi:MAG: glycoside hydrolase family 31 protein, partial [Angelakisella sp.]
GFTGGQQYPIHWAGDQISSWSELRGQLTAGLSLGLSGVPFWGFDIGGFANAMPTAELYLRATAFAAFAPVMQFHSEPRSGQFY